MANSKIVFGGEVLMDLTADTVTKDKLLKDVTAHGADGEAITGECTFDSDTQDATVTVAEILKETSCCVVHPGWCTAYLNQNESLQELNEAVKEMRSEVNSTPTYKQYQKAS